MAKIQASLKVSRANKKDYKKKKNIKITSSR